MRHRVLGTEWLQRRRGMVAAVIGSLSTVLLLASATVTAAQPRSITASDVRGCCVCRGTAGGDASGVRSCSDGMSVDACSNQCTTENADSLAFGYQQTCSQGCAGFPTQSPK